MSSSPDAVKAFAAASKQWESDEVSRARKSEKRAYMIAGGAIIGMIAMAIALAGLTPLKSTEPFVVLADKTTGDGETVTLLDTHTLTASEALDKYWLSRYVNYREEYSNAMAFPNYKAIMLMSTHEIGDAYYAQINPANPHAPVNVYHKDGAVEVVVTSISFLGNNVAQVHFTRTETGGAGVNGPVTQWIATITYRYLQASLKESDRLIDPVGFQVTDYRLDPVIVKTGG